MSLSFLYNYLQIRSHSFEDALKESRLSESKALATLEEERQNHHQTKQILSQTRNEQGQSVLVIARLSKRIDQQQETVSIDLDKCFY